MAGWDLLPVSLATHLEGKIQLETEVTGIKNNGKSVEVSIRTADQKRQTLTADYVICTIPFTVLRRLDLRLNDPSKRFAINTLKYASMTKVILNCRERFWETKYGIFGGASVSDQVTRWTYYPSDHVDNSIRQTIPTPHLRGISGHSFHVGQVSGHPDKSKIGGAGVLLAGLRAG